jgi:broad specificity phosphatase PhoE
MALLGPSDHPMPEILLIRHAESDANVAGLWQGRGDSDLSSEGRDQVEALRRRLGHVDFAAVISSPLTRARHTAVAVGESEVDSDLVEVDLGEWEDRPFAEVSENHGPSLSALYRGHDGPFGFTGERMSEVAVRAWRAIDRVAERVGGDGKIAVVTHGGVIDAVFSTFLPARTRRPHRMASNTALTHLVGGPGRWRLARFNDATHLDPLPAPVRAHLATGGAVLSLIRHGRTRANSERRWQGQSCWGLDDEGRHQADRLAEWYGRLEHLYASPLGRAQATAAAVARGKVVLDPGLMEIGVGYWEGLDMREVRSRWPELARRIFDDGEDLPRGETGETWQGVTDRVTSAIGNLRAPGGSLTGVVTHGGVIRAFVGSLGGGGPATVSSFHTPANTSVTHVALTSEGPILCDYAVAPHLERTLFDP